MQRIWLESLNHWPGQGLVSVLGPTGSGKTATVIQFVKERYPNSKEPLLVSIDAVTVYRDLNIGSAKPTSEERENFSWIGLDCFEPTADAAVSNFLKEVVPAVKMAITDSRPVILVGGSHFYEKALVEGMSPGEASSPEYQATLAAVPAAILHERLRQADPRIAERLHSNDRYRLERYLDLVERQGLGYAQLFSKNQDRGLASMGVENIHCLALGMSIDTETFYKKLSNRIHAMLQSGWIEETQELMNRFGAGAKALQSVGYREIVAFINGQLPQEQLEEAILISHRQLAKKQRTWIRGLRAKSAV